VDERHGTIMLSLWRRGLAAITRRYHGRLV
jgi:hypothetical protein